MRRMLVLSAIILTMIFVSVSIAQPMSTSKTNISTDNFNLISTNPITTNPISAVGHGVALDAEGNKIDVTPEFIRKAQRYYIRSLLHQANKKQRAKFWKKRKHLLELKGEECDPRVPGRREFRVNCLVDQKSKARECEWFGEHKYLLAYRVRY